MSDYNQTFEQATDEYLGDLYAAEPVTATRVGVHAFDHNLPNRNQYAIDERLRASRAYLHRIDQLSIVGMNSQARVDYRFARAATQADIVRLEQVRPYHTRPDAYIQDAVDGIYFLLVRNHLSATDRAEALISRLRLIQELFAQARANLQNPSAVHVDAALETCAAAHVLFESQLPEFGQKLRNPGLRRAFDEAVQIGWEAFADFEHFLSDDLKPRANGDIAVGRELYEYMLRVGEFIEQSCDEIEAVCEIIAVEAEAEMRQLCNEIDPDREWPEILADCPRVEPPVLLLAYRDEIGRLREFVEANELASLPGDIQLRVMETPHLWRNLHPGARYVPPAPFESNSPAEMWIDPVNGRPDSGGWPPVSQSKCEIAHAASRMAYPGHHLQVSHSIGAGPRLRTHFGSSRSFCEGWALYVEELMHEAGYYPDTRSRMFLLRSQLRRAWAAVIEIGIHCRGMAACEAVDLLAQKARIDRWQSQFDVRRAVIAPGTHVVGVMGKRAIENIRCKAERRQGAQFNLQRFHDEVLSYGAVPPRLIRDSMFEV